LQAVLVSQVQGTKRSLEDSIFADKPRAKLSDIHYIDTQEK